MKNIVLIGFMGVGKGTVARALAQRLHMVCLDTDDLIESMENQSVKKIFQTKGEAYFRQKEQEIAYWLARSVQSAIVSTGGGFYKVTDLKQIGTIVYLRSSFDKIIQRIHQHPNAKKKIAKRPLLQDMKKAQSLHKQRAEIYSQMCDITVDVTEKPLQKIVDEVARSL